MKKGIIQTTAISYLSFLCILLASWSSVHGGNGKLQLSEKKDSLKKYRKLGNKHFSNKNYDKALDNFEHILDIKKSIYPENHSEIAKVYANIGVVYKRQGQLEHSLTHYKKAIQIYNRNSGIKNRSLGTLYSNMGNIFTLQKNYKKAEGYYNQAINLLSKDSLSNLDRISMAYNNLGLLYKDQKLYKQSIHYYTKSYQLKKKLDLSVITTLINLANTYKEAGDINKAEKYYSLTKQVILKKYGKNSNYLGSYYLNHGITKLQRNNFDEAEQYFQKALRIFSNSFGEKHPKTSNGYINLGDVFFNQDEYNKSVQYYQKALISISDSFNTRNLSENPEIKNVFSKNSLLKILKRKANGIKNIQKNRIKNLKLSLNTYDHALKVIRNIRLGYLNENAKLDLTAKERETFINSIKVSTKLYNKTKNKSYLEKALNYSERSKAAVLYENIQSNQALKIANIPDSLQQKENQIKKKIWTFEELIYEEKQKGNPNNKQIEYWNDQLFRLKSEHEHLIALFEKKYPKYHQLKYNLKVPAKSYIQNKLQKDEIILEYVLTEKQLYSFIIKKNNLVLRQTPVDSSFFSDIQALQHFVERRNFSDHSIEDFNHFNEISHKLYSKLIEPLTIKKDKRLIIIPDDILSYIPFEILIKHKSEFEKIRYKDLSYLIKDHPVSYSYSAKVLFNQRNTQNNIRNKLGAYAPSYENIEELPDNALSTRQKYRERLYPLKGIIKEVNRISEIVPGKVFTKKKATEKHFKNTSGNFDILHLAMHTIIDDDDPMYSKMAFTQTTNDGEDNFLNTYEIYNLNLKSRLTVLSSCNTGFGKLNKGEGVMSLARGFKYAGCPSIVMTLWPVEDNSSIRLMEYFYEALKKGETKDKAIQTAKVKFLNNSDRLHAHPYFWSGYISIGEQSSVFFPNYYYWIGGLLLLIVFTVAFILVKRLQK